MLHRRHLVLAFAAAPALAAAQGRARTARPGALAPAGSGAVAETPLTRGARGCRSAPMSERSAGRHSGWAGRSGSFAPSEGAARGA